MQGVACQVCSPCQQALHRVPIGERGQPCDPWVCGGRLLCADPVTKAWLEANMDRVFGFPDLVRFSWQTCTRMLEDRAVRVQW